MPKKTTRPSSATRRSTGPIPHLGSLEEFIPYKLSVVANRVSQSIGRLFNARFNVQMTEWRILMALFAYGDMAFYDVVERTSMDKARVSRAQRRLVDLELATATVDPDDRRSVILSLTKKGKNICLAIAPEARRMEAWFLTVLTPQERQQFDGVLDKLFARSKQLTSDPDPLLGSIK